MKKNIYALLPLIMVIMSFQFVRAQDVNIPDANFKSYLLYNQGINTNNDGEIQEAEAAAFTGNLQVSNKNITDLTGIEAFVNITRLECFINHLKSLDLSHNTALTSVLCYENNLQSLDVSSNSMLVLLSTHHNQLTQLNVSSNLLLEHLACSSNQLTSLDVSANHGLTALYCFENQLTSLNVSKNKLLEEVICYSNRLTYLNVKNGHNTSFNYFTFGAVNNPGLTCIQVDDPAYMDANLANAKDATASYSLNCGCTGIINIPDAAFKAALTGNPDININGDGEIQCSEAAAYTGDINVQGLGISDLTGIEAFTSINYLNCSNNQLTSVDVSANRALRLFFCSQNQLTGLDVSNNTSLIVLFCGANQITILDVTNNTLLQNLDCSQNQISSLILSSNQQLTSLNCSGNQLADLDVKSNPLLGDLTCGWNPLMSLDLTHNRALSYLEFSTTNIPDINLHENVNLTFIGCIQGQLTSLDLSASPLLTNLNCQANFITSLDLSANTVLNSLVCHTNLLTSLDLSANNQLTSLACENNPLLTTVNIKNGNNSNLTGIDLINNPNLTCIQVDDAAFMNDYWGNNKDETANFSNNCNYCPTYFASLGLASGSASVICAGSSTNLAVNITGASASNTYFDIHYSDGSNAITSRVFVTGSNVTAPFSESPVITTNYKLISITDANGCSGLIGPATSDTFEVVTVNTMPVITATPSITTDLCPGSPVKLTSSRQSNYDWSNGKTSRSVTVVTAGDYTVSTNAAGGCTLTSAPVTVSYQACAAPSGISVDNVTGTTARINFAPVACGESYIVRYKVRNTAVWSRIDGITVSPYILSGLTPNTSYNMQMRTVCKSSPVRYSALTIGYVFKTAAAYANTAQGTDALQTNNVWSATLYPNPASSHATINISGTGKPVTITLTDLAGKVLQQHTNVSAKQYQLPLSNLAGGVYLVTLNDGENKQTLKLVKE